MGFEGQKQAPKRQRSCIGCATKDNKMVLYRVVRTPDGSVVFDKTGRQAGRGAYVCSVACLEKANKQGKLARGLKCSIEASAYQNVHDELRQYIAESSIE